MEEKHLSKYFYLGTCVRYLEDVKAGERINGDNFVEGNINAVIKFLNEFDLAVTLRTYAVEKLKKFYDEIDDEVKAVLTREQAINLNEAMTEVRATLEAELSGFTVFFVSPKRIDVNKLLEDIPGLFPPKIYSNMPEIAQYDFSEAGRCIAFERPTAAAFHMLRGTEAVLRNFYSNLIRQKRISPLLWGPMVADLRNHRKTKNYQTLYNNLDNIRQSYRNPTQHPEAIYDIHEAQDLWGLCTEVVNRMTNILIIQ